MPLFWTSTNNASWLAWIAQGRGLSGVVWENAAMKKTELMERVREAHEKLTKALEGLTEEEAARTGLNSEWSVKDALSHITAWEIEGARTLSEIQNGTWKPQKLN